MAHNTAGRADHRPGQNHVCYTDEHRHQIRDSAWTVGRVSGQGPAQAAAAVTALMSVTEETIGSWCAGVVSRWDVAVSQDGSRGLV